MTARPKTVATTIASAIKRLTKPGKIWLVICLGLFLTSATGLVWQTNKNLLAAVPTSGGELREGLVGAPRFINPLLAISNSDRDLTTLIYSGLLRINQSGQLIPDLAERFSVSADELQYTFILKPDLVWHDGEPVTSDDVVFTINRIKDPAFKSPRRNNWEGIEVKKITERELTFNLKQPRGSFLENATLGILPAHLWQPVAPEIFPFHELNLKGIGTGPYRPTNLERDRGDLPTAYVLTPFEHFALGQAKIKKLIIRFYPNENDLLTAYRRGEIESVNAVPPASVKSLITNENQLIIAPLTRVFAVFFNQNQGKIFAQTEVRSALNLLIDRPKLIEQILAGYGEPADKPLPPVHPSPPEIIPARSAAPDATEAAAALLTKHKWEKNADSGLWQQTIKDETKTLAFTLSTAETEELKATAAYLKTVWEKFGARVEVKIFEAGALSQNIIRPREYEALLFGEIVGREADLYAFWHSSQRLDPGLNVALYTNVTVDKMLEKLKTADPRDRFQETRLAAETIANDTPAVFLYSPQFIYIMPKTVKGVTLGPINTPAERFFNIHQWYLTTEKVWPFFRSTANEQI